MQNHTYSRRSFLRMSTLAAGASIIAACVAAPVPNQLGTEQSMDVTTQEVATIRYSNFDWWAFAPGVQWDMYHQQEAFPRFQDEHPNVDLQWEPFGGFGSGWDSKVLTQMAAGTAPDVMTSWPPISNIWAEKKQLLDLQPLVDADIPEAEEIFPQSIWHQTWDPVSETRFGLAADVLVSSLYYDKDAFEEAGIAPPTEAWTVDTYTEAAVKLTQRDGNGNVTRWGGQIRPDFVQGYFFYVEAFGGQVCDPETRLICGLGEEPAQQGLEWIRHGMWDLNCFAQDVQINATGLPDTWTGLLPAKVVASVERVSDQFFSLAANMPEGSWNIMHIPQGPHSRACMGIPDIWSIYKGVTERGNQDAVWQFTKWMATSDYYQENLAKKAGRVPALSNMAAKWPTFLRTIEPRLESVDLEVILDQVARGEAHELPLFRFQSVASELLIPAMQQIYIEGKAGVELLKEIAPKITAAQQEALARSGEM